MYRMLFALVVWMVAIGLLVKDEPKPEITAQVTPQSASAQPSAAAAPANDSNSARTRLSPMEKTPYHQAAVTTDLIPVNFTAPQEPPQVAVRSQDAPAGYTPLPTAKTTPEETIASLPIYEVTGTRVNMRAGPSTGHAVVSALGRGTQTQYLGAHGGWAQIKVVETGARGFIAAKFIKPVSTN